MPRRFIAVYYLLTPAFWIADAYGANLRVAALDGFPIWKVIYYLFCFACGVAIWKRPDWTSIVGLSEASLNILLSLLGIAVPYFGMIDELAAGNTVIDTSSLSPERIAGLLLSAAVWVTAFHVRLAALRSGRSSTEARL